MQAWRCLSIALIALMTLENVTTITNNKNNKRITNILKAVKLPGGYMEIIQEDYCSDIKIIRLTCRSLRAFIFVLEAEYQREKTITCGSNYNNTSELINNKNSVKISDSDKNNKKIDNSKRSILFRDYHPKPITMVQIKLRGNYFRDEKDENNLIIDMRNSFNRKCSGHHHCRFNMPDNHPGSSKWQPANLHLKYACIPEAAVRRYCNVEVTINEGETGYIKSPGYPLYYQGEHTCGWIFKTIPGRRISLVFHDLNIRSPESNGNCVDFIRIEENDKIIFESCGTKIGTTIISKTNKIILHFITSSKLYPARGFFLKYEAIGCPDIIPPNGSFISNDTHNTRTFQCHSGNIFSDTGKQSKTLDCQGKNWNKTINLLPACINATTSTILKTETDNNRLTDLSSDNILGAGVRFDRAENKYINMDDSDVFIPCTIIGMIIFCNFFIVYFIFQHRKRLGYDETKEAVAFNKKTAVVTGAGPSLV
ncbi:uncharacterized protein LOC122855806 isoform X3 [Aphidius gifuensis]|uniref:uncharacterized protein LOC122855806 isoform X3 n=1 Tax=Aphidius gifuensis TaxID=684658 RepID=UPI001CDCD94B|nr:uncharacterized protein LOC122855806 isoform X3 [Aphidius gifuensis]